MSAVYGYRLSTGYGRGWSKIHIPEGYTSFADVAEYAVRVSEARGVYGPCIRITRNGRVVRTLTVQAIGPREVLS